MNMKASLTTLLLFACIVLGGTDVDTKKVSLMEGDPATLNTDVQITPEHRIKCYWNNILIFKLSGSLIHTSTDIQCPEQFKDRLTFDHETGSLTIANTKTADSGVYRLQINGGGSSVDKLFNVTITGVDKDSVSVSVKEGDSVTLQIDSKTSQQKKIRWYFFENSIAFLIQGEKSICTNVECAKRFNDRLELDTQTGSLTITNINTTHDGLYRLLIGNDVKIFNVSVHDVPAAERDEMKTKSVVEGESVTLDPHLMKYPNDEITWYFNDCLIAKMTRGQSQICSVNKCDEIFKDRLKLDNQTGSLTITDTKTTDSGEYNLHISISGLGVRHRRSISITSTSVKSFRIAVTASSLSKGAVAGIFVGVVLLVAVAVAAVVGVILHRRRTHLQVPQRETVEMVYIPCSYRHN